MTGRQVVAGVISNEQICIPIRLEICHNRKRSLPDGSVARLKRELQETVLAAYERREYRICERLYVDGLGWVLAANNGDPTIYSIVVEDDFNGGTISDSGVDLFDLIDDLDVHLEETVLIVEFPLTDGQVA